ncbi:hypothetical protein XENORESO_001555 [Xenotaenia resolanae]|uniref:Uncharacterized protein n=1 Tax=Xenotaenia resolanae TaxID=208358 RepID=A0ABV0WCB8_9TELE
MEIEERKVGDTILGFTSTPVTSPCSPAPKALMDALIEEAAVKHRQGVWASVLGECKGLCSLCRGGETAPEQEQVQHLSSDFLNCLRLRYLAAGSFYVEDVRRKKNTTV